MNNIKKQLELRLIANVLMDKCAHKQNWIFSDSLCSQERVIRFTTNFMRSLFPPTGKDNGKWKTGDQVMYEIEISAASVVVNCVYYPTTVPKFSVSLLKTWDISAQNINEIFDKFDVLSSKDIPSFEAKIKDMVAVEYVEGSKKIVYTTKYERNPQARAACLAYYGYACKICGMNFGDTYGPDFKEIIEVHHIVPISEIGKDYVVDPIKDLIPICPNCHAAIHSKSGHNLKY